MTISQIIDMIEEELCRKATKDEIEDCLQWLARADQEKKLNERNRN